MSPFHALVSGSREWDDAEAVESVLRSAEHRCGTVGRELVVVHGACPAGVDAIADAWCKRTIVAFRSFPADWYAPCDPVSCTPGHRRRDRRGRTTCPAAGVYRNQFMLDALPIDVVLAWPLPQGSGTQDMVRRAKAAGVPVRTFGPLGEPTLFEPFEGLL